MTPTSAVIEQRDRDAAAKLASLSAFDPEAWEAVEAVRNGERDLAPIVQAFARHAALSSHAVVAQIVAWLERNGDEEDAEIARAIARGDYLTTPADPKDARERP